MNRLFALLLAFPRRLSRYFFGRKDEREKEERYILAERVNCQLSFRPDDGVDPGWPRNRLSAKKSSLKKN